MVVDTDVTFIGETIEMPLTFPPGQSTMTVESAVVRSTRNRHRLQTRAGQFLSIELRAAEHNAEFTVHDRHGALLAEVTGEAGWHAWSGALIEDGEVAITIYSRRGNAAYWLAVTLSEMVTPRPRPIRFEAGATGATLSGRLADGGAADDYLLSLREGQWLSWLIDAVGDGVGEGWEASSTLIVPGGAWSGGPFGTHDVAHPAGRSVALGLARVPMTGRYTLGVSAMGPDAPATIAYEMTLHVPVGEPTRVRFRPGSSSARLTGRLERLAIDRYALGAREGQSMTLTLTPPSAALTVLLVTPANRRASALWHRLLPDLATGLSLPLEGTGDYLLAITSADDGHSYRLDVRID